MKFKVGDEVKIIKNEWDSINHIGDIGTITEINNLDYRVYVKGRDYHGTKNVGNWHGEDELELVIDDSPQVIRDLDYFKENAKENYITTPISVLRYISELENALEIQKMI
jgi:hypothetical protein